jgi:hypothetical protein
VTRALPKVAFAVMGHHSRLDHLTELCDSLHAEPFVDTGDRTGPEAERRIGDTAWRYGAGGDWTVVLQDDALPIPELRRHATEALAHAPQTAVSLYFGAGRPQAGLTGWAARRADSRAVSWIEWDDLYWGVAVAMPTAAVEDFLAWGATSALRYDRRIGAFWRAQGKPIWYTWPSLVDHDDTVPTLAHRNPSTVRRVAYRVGVPAGLPGSVMAIGAVRSRLSARTLSE